MLLARAPLIRHRIIAFARIHPILLTSAELHAPFDLRLEPRGAVLPSVIFGASVVDLEQLASRPQAPCGAEPFHTWNCQDGTTWTAFHRYELGGLRIVSDLPLVGLQACHNEARADGNEVVIRHAAIPESLALNTATFRNGRFFRGGYNGKEVLLDIPEAGRILVRAGKEIVLDWLPCSSDGEVRSYLLGSALGAVSPARYCAASLFCRRRPGRLRCLCGRLRCG